MAGSAIHPVTILLAEDDDGHAILIQDALRDAGLLNAVLRFKDGRELLDHLDRHSEAGATQPWGSHLLLLDINMPRVDGPEVLQAMKTAPHLKDLPVIMLSTTDDPREIQRCHDLGCSGYLTKPVNFLNFLSLLSRVGLFLQAVKCLPLGEEGGQA